jgi:hypothetical protein
MLEVTIRMDMADADRALRIEGYVEFYPVVGKPFYCIIDRGGAKVYLDFGTVRNIRHYRDLLLIQTDLVVVEVLLKSGSKEDWANVLPFAKPISSPAQGKAKRKIERRRV